VIVVDSEDDVSPFISNHHELKSLPIQWQDYVSLETNLSKEQLKAMTKQIYGTYAKLRSVLNKSPY